MDIKFKNTKSIPSFSFEKETKQEDKQDTLCMEVAELVTELMNAATSFHKLHLKVTGLGSFAQHKALQDYDKFHEFSDNLCEEMQGASNKLLDLKELPIKVLQGKDDTIKYLDELKTMITEVQQKLPYSEIINLLDNVKSTINSMKYKILFLQ